MDSNSGRGDGAQSLLKQLSSLGLFSHTGVDVTGDILAASAPVCGVTSPRTRAPPPRGSGSEPSRATTSRKSPRSPRSSLQEVRLQAVTESARGPAGHHQQSQKQHYQHTPRRSPASPPSWNSTLSSTSSTSSKCRSPYAEIPVLDVELGSHTPSREHTHSRASKQRVSLRNMVSSRTGGGPPSVEKPPPKTASTKAWLSPSAGDKLNIPDEVEYQRQLDALSRRVLASSSPSMTPSSSSSTPSSRLRQEARDRFHSQDLTTWSWTQQQSNLLWPQDFPSPPAPHGTLAGKDSSSRHHGNPSTGLQEAGSKESQWTTLVAIGEEAVDAALREGPWHQRSQSEGSSGTVFHRSCADTEVEVETSPPILKVSNANTDASVARTGGPLAVPQPPPCAHPGTAVRSARHFRETRLTGEKTPSPPLQSASVDRSGNGHSSSTGVLSSQKQKRRQGSDPHREAAGRHRNRTRRGRPHTPENMDVELEEYMEKLRKLQAHVSHTALDTSTSGGTLPGSPTSMNASPPCKSILAVLPNAEDPAEPSLRNLPHNRVASPRALPSSAAGTASGESARTTPLSPRPPASRGGPPRKRILDAGTSRRKPGAETLPEDTPRKRKHGKKKAPVPTVEEVRTEAAAVLQQLQVLASRRTQEMREIQGVSQALCPMAEEEGPDSMLQAVISLSANREMHRIVQEDQLVQDFMKLQAQFDTLAWKNSDLTSLLASKDGVLELADSRSTGVSPIVAVLESMYQQRRSLSGLLESIVVRRSAPSPPKVCSE